MLLSGDMLHLLLLIKWRKYITNKILKVFIFSSWCSYEDEIRYCVWYAFCTQHAMYIQNMSISWKENILYMWGALKLLWAMKLLITQITKPMKWKAFWEILTNAFNNGKCYIKYNFFVFLDKSNRYKEKIIVLTSWLIVPDMNHLKVDNHMCSVYPGISRHF